MKLSRGLVVGVWLVACNGGEPHVAERQSVIPAAPLSGTPAPGARVNPRLLRRFKQVASQRPAPPSSPEMVALGRKLWFDVRLSKSGEISCNSCHTLATYGVDGKTISTGIDEQLGRRNSPTVYNSAEHFVMFWDGRASDAETQAISPIQNPVEMGMTEAGVVKTIEEIPGYVGDFSRAFPSESNPVSLNNVGRAIGAFERGLVTRSRWDDYLEGKESALSDAEVDGLRVFLNVGCMGCHTGPQVGASMFQVAGFVEPWPNQSDLGRFELTKNVSDRMMFKVPSLKNIAKTGPYFHDGSGKTLPAAVKLMGRHQLGVDLTDPEVIAIVTFLGALTGELPADYIRQPALPAGTKAEATGAR